MEDNNYVDPYASSCNAGSTGEFTPEYAGFWFRFAASLIDGLVIGALAMIIIIPMIIVMFLLASLMNTGSDDSTVLGTILCCCYCLVLIIALAGQWLYFAWFESSKYMGTPGKFLLGLKVTNMDGGRLTFTQATLRYVAKILTNIVFYLGYISIAFTSKKQGLYDMIAGTLVIRK